MKVALDKVRPNPFRDFTLYPLDEEQLDRLQRSITDDGFLASVVARPSPTEKGAYELAMGHHRIEACLRAGLTHVEIHVEPFDDLQMVRIMSRENLSQRGHNAGAGLDSVAATARLIAFAVLAADTVEKDGNEDVWRILQTSGITVQRSLETARPLIASDGPGRHLIYRAVNSFDIDRKGDEKRAGRAEHMSETEIREALTRLKASGYMAQIVSWAQDKASAVLAERREAEEKEAREEERRRDAEAERRAAAERRAKDDAAKKAREAAEARVQAEKAAADVKVRARKEAERKERESTEAAAEQRRLAELGKADEAARAEREKAEKAKRREREKADAGAAKRAEAIAAQAARKPIYDIRCDQVFRDRPNHAQAFMEVVTSKFGLESLPFDAQLALARAIRDEVDEMQARRGITLGSATVADFVEQRLLVIRLGQRKIDDSERERVLLNSAISRVEHRWARLSRHASAAEAELLHLRRELKQWEFNKRLFPIQIEKLDLMVETLTNIRRLRDAIIGQGDAADRKTDEGQKPVLALSSTAPPTIDLDD